MSDIYQAPTAPLTQDVAVDGYGSIERALAGDFELKLGDVISEAWEKTNGAKWTLNVALSLYCLVYFAVAIGLPLVVGVLTGGDGGIISVLVSLIAMAISLPMGMGLFILGLKRAVGAPIAAGEVMNYFHKTGPLLLTMILVYLLLMLGFLLLVIPGIYLAVAYYFALPLVVEKGLSPWEAMETSRKAVTKCWFTVFGFFIVMGLISIVAMIPLGIGLIWVMPMMLIGYGIMYRNIFGYSGNAENA